MARFLSLRLVYLAALLGLLVPASAAAASGDPAANRSLSPATWRACSENPTSGACISSALADINAARAAEGVRAMVLPGGFASMSVPVQLLNLANLERVDRGLAPILGLSAALDQDAQSGAAQDADPMPTHFYGNEATSNWAGGDNSALEADFEWMYDDGPGSGNLDCTSSDSSGCWGHRHDILWHFSSPIAMGAGDATGQYGPSMTELFVGGDTRTAPGQPDAPVARPSPSGATTGTSTGAGSNPSASAAGTGAGQTTPTARPRAAVVKLVAAHHAVRLVVRCAAALGRVCKLAVTITARLGGASGHGSERQLASTVALTVQSRASTAINLALDRAMERLLARQRKLLVHVLVKQYGSSALANRTLRLTF